MDDKYVESKNDLAKYNVKKKLRRYVYDYILVTLGTFLLAFGSVIFLTKCELVAGGVSGIAIIIQHFFATNIYDYLVAGLMVFFWLLGFFLVGKRFAIRTLFSSLLFIGFTFLLNRVEFFTTLAYTFAGMNDGATPTVGNYILCGLFGGVFVGGGVALTFLGGGSSGGVDCIQFIVKRFVNIKESITSFVVDALIVVIGMIVMQMWIPALCGILSGFVVSVMIDVIYNHSQTSYQADIISNHWEEINEYVQIKMDRGSTIIKAFGGFRGEERIILRIVFDRTQYDELRAIIRKIDPNAFVTFTQTNAVYGEGFIVNEKKIKKEEKK